jgi:two-component system, NarL family, sensor kinase
MELAIFRFVQECLTNTHRHSGSKGARITVGRKGENIYVEVQDHGKGMSRERLAAVQSHGVGVGLRGMRERVRQLHGEFSIESNSLGTRTSATLPTKTRATNEPATTQQRLVS